MMRLFLCARLPWHRWSLVRPLSLCSDLWRCSCGRLYATNDDVRAVLPWEKVRKFYESSPTAQAFAEMMARR